MAKKDSKKETKKPTKKVEDNKLSDKEIDSMERPEGVSRQAHRATIRRVEKIRDKLVKDPALLGAVTVLMKKGFNTEDLNISYRLLEHFTRQNG